jgi:hypothetical protein
VYDESSPAGRTSRTATASASVAGSVWARTACSQGTQKASSPTSSFGSCPIPTRNSHRFAHAHILPGRAPRHEPCIGICAPRSGHAIGTSRWHFGVSLWGYAAVASSRVCVRAHGAG